MIQSKTGFCALAAKRKTFGLHDAICNPILRNPTDNTGALTVIDLGFLQS